MLNKQQRQQTVGGFLAALGFDLAQHTTYGIAMFEMRLNILTTVTVFTSVFNWQSQKKIYIKNITLVISCLTILLIVSHDMATAVTKFPFFAFFTMWR